jgi:monofunctional biosynthetic peptidoglycan transglycosylase
VKRLALAVLALVLVLPSLLILTVRFLDPPVSALMLIRRAQGYGTTQQWRPYAALGAMPKAAVAAEDSAFCSERFGFDPDSIRHQFEIWRAGGRPGGASTIAMQLARNLFLWPGRSVLRKAIEIVLTPQIALLLPRRRQLEIYLNIVEFAPGIYGAEAGAQHWFARPAASLAPDEALHLVGVLPAPLHASPHAPTPGMAALYAAAWRLIATGDVRLDCVD